MNYVERNLRNGEKIIAKAKISIVASIPAIAFAILLLIIGAAADYFGFGFLIAVAVLIVQYVRIQSVELCITDKKVIGKYGVFHIKSMDSYLDHIDNVSVSQSLLGRMFDYSTISICTVSGHYNFPYVAAPIAFKHITMDQIEKYEEDKMCKQAQINVAYSSNVQAASSNVCPKCKSLVESGSKFCPACGQQIR